MKKHVLIQAFIAFAFILLCGAVQAQPVPLTFVPMKCLAETPYTVALGATGKGYVGFSHPSRDYFTGLPNPAGRPVLVNAWWCENVNGTWSPYVHRCIEGRTCLSISSMFDELELLIDAPDKFNHIKNVVHGRTAYPDRAEMDDWEAAGFAAIDALKLTEPPAARWVVAPTATGVTVRPMFLLPDLRPSTRQAIVGRACDCDTYAEGPDGLYCTLPKPYIQTVATLCVKQ